MVFRGRRGRCRLDSDVRAGPGSVLRVLDTQVVQNPAWEETLLVLTYDEHGGFFDHVEPPRAPKTTTRRPNHAPYGPELPAIVVSARRAAGPSPEPFDHTSIIKTCLTPFYPQEAGLIPDMGARVNAANHLGVLLEKDVQVARPGDAALGGLVHQAQALARGVPAGGGRRTERGRAAGSRGPHRLSGGLRGWTRAILDSITRRERDGAEKAPRSSRHVLEPGVAVEPLGQLSGPAERDVCR